MAPDSVAKLAEVLDCARALGVHVGPLRVQLAATTTRVSASSRPSAGASASAGTARRDDEAERTRANNSEDGTDPPAAVLVVPLYGWYHSSWDTDPNITDPQFLAVERSVPFSRKWGDYAMCTWPGEIVSHSDFVTNPADNTALAEVFAKLNEPYLHPTPDRTAPSFDPTAPYLSPERFLGSPLASATDTVVSYSHYLPRLELCPEKRFLTEPLLAKVVGSDVLESQVRRLQPHLHLYGHTHIPIGERLLSLPTLPTLCSLVLMGRTRCLVCPEPRDDTAPISVLVPGSPPTAPPSLTRSLQTWSWKASATCSGRWATSERPTCSARPSTARAP